MSDKVIGIAVLDRTGPVQYLTVMCAYPDGKNEPSCIPVLPRGSLKQVTNEWQYVMRGDVLDVTPSLKISTTQPSKANPAVNEVVELFHNEGAWSIPFKEFEPGEYVQAYDLFRFLNPTLA